MLENKDERKEESSVQPKNEAPLMICKIYWLIGDIS